MTNPTLQQLADEALETGMLVITERNTLRARVAELEFSHDSRGQTIQNLALLVSKKNSEIHYLRTTNAELEAELNGYKAIINVAEWRALIKQRDELEAERANAGWLAQMVIDKLGGTNDLPSWVQQSAKYYRRCQDELRQANAKVAELEARLAVPLGT